jgi:hypothetical protein
MKGASEMNKKILKLLCLFVMAGMVFAVASCAKENEKEKLQSGKTETPGESVNGENTATEEAEVKILPDLPDQTFDGYTFTFLSFGGNENPDWVTADPREIVPQYETENGEPINDAVHKRNIMIEDKYKIKINMITTTDEIGKLNKAVKADTDEYDAVLMLNNIKEAFAPIAVLMGLIVFMSNGIYFSAKALVNVCEFSCGGHGKIVLPS